MRQLDDARFKLVVIGEQPNLATELDGLLDLLADGQTGYVVHRSGVSIAAGLRRFGSLEAKLMA